MESPARSRLKPAEIAALAGLALAARTFNLGTFSLWLDEILLALRAQGSLAATWAACRANAEHPPLSALAMNVLYALGCNDTVQRLLPIALGVATVVLLATWTAAHFGRAAGLFAGLVIALNAIQVRYSQELRPYVYLLFFVALALHAADRVAEGGRRRDVALLTGALAGALYSHYLGALTVVVLAVQHLPRLLGASREARRAGVRALAALGAAVIAAAVVYTPWLAAVAALADRGPRGGSAHWSLRAAADRWEVLAVGMRDGDTLTWAGVAMLLVALIGGVVALRRAAGVAVAAGAVVGTAGVEIMLLRAHHWSNARYDLFGGMFFCVLAGIGAGWLATRRPRPVPAVLVLAFLGAVSWSGLHRYAAFGRPTWDRVAATVRAMLRPGEALFVENEWTRISLAYYLQGKDFEKQKDEDDAPIAVRGDISRLARGWSAGSCALIVAAGNPLYPPLEYRLNRFPKLAHFPSSDEARVYLLSPQVRRQLYESGWTEIGPADLSVSSSCGDSLRLLPAELRVPEPYVWTRLLRAAGLAREPSGETVRLDFDAAGTARSLARGWSSFEKDPGGTTFVWAMGYEAHLSLWCERPRPRLLRIRLRPCHVPGRQQTLAAFINGEPLGEVRLDDGFQDVRLLTDTAHWRVGENLLTLRFAYAVSPADVDPGAADTRPLAVAFDCLEVFER